MHQYYGPTNKLMNCATASGGSDWGKWEEKGASPSAAICHGGTFNGQLYAMCPSRWDCRIETKRLEAIEKAASQQKLEDRRHHLPVVQGGGGIQVIGSTPAAQRAPVPPTNPFQSWSQPAAPTSLRPTGTVAGAPAAAFAPPAITPRGFSPPGHAPVPIMPPEMYPTHMRTPYAHGPHHYPMGGVTPTFLPAEDESILARLGKNVVQGAIGSTGWHTFALAQSIDFFRK
jgi:hypothetical protein